MKCSLKHLLLFSFILVGLAVSASAQETYNSSGRRVPMNKKKEGGFDPQKLVFGGGIGLGFGPITSVAASPIVGYRFTDRLLAGVGVGFQYVRWRDYFPVYNQVSQNTDYYPLKSTFFFPSVWARYLVFENIFVHVEGEYDMQNFKVYDRASDPNGNPVSQNQKFNSPALLVGGGLRQPISDRSSFVVMALYDVIQHEYSPYRNRIDVRIGFNVGF